MRQQAVDLSAQPIRNLHRNSSGLGGAANLVGYWSGQSPNAVDATASTTDWPLSRKAGRLTWTTRTSPTGDIGMTMGSDFVPQIAGRKVTAVFDIVASVGGWNLGEMILGNLIPNASGTVHAASPSGRAMSAGLPMRCWITFTVPVGTVNVGSVRVNVGGLPLTAGVWVEASNMDLYFGDYVPTRIAGNGDLPGWQWDGAVGASGSVGYPWALDPKLVRQRVRNLALNPSGKVSSTGFNFSTQTGTGTIARPTTGGPDGGSYVRRTWTGTATSTPGADILTYGQSVWGGQGLPSTIPLVAGRTYTLAVKVRPSRDARLRLNPQSITGSGGGTGIPNGPDTLCPANVWTRLAATFIAPTGASAVRLDVDNAAVAPTAAWDIGDTLDAAQVLAMEGADPGIYMDGDTPGWAWLGTPGESISEGYPYTLESIAGPPGEVRITPGTTASSEATQPSDPLGGRTLYAVLDVINSTSGFDAVGVYGVVNASVGRISISTSTAGGSTMQARFDTANGSSNLTSIVSGVRTPGRHVAAASLVDGLTSGTLAMDGGADVVRSSINPGDGILSGAVTLYPATASTIPVAVYAYPAYHDRETRQRITAWLARQYGAPVPAGY